MKWNDKFNNKYASISIYVIVTTVIIYILGLVAKNAPQILSGTLRRVEWLMGVSKPIIIGFVFAYLLEPLVNYIQGQYNKIRLKNWKIKATRTLSVLTTVIIIFVILIGVISLLVYNVTNQLRLANLDDIFILINSYMKAFNDFYHSVLDWLVDLNIQSAEVSQYIKNAMSYLLNALENFGVSTVISVGNISSFITTFIFSLIISIYFMIDGKMITAYMRKVGKALFNDKWNTRISNFLKDSDVVFSGYFRGQLLDAFVMVILISLLLSVIGVKYGILIGILAGIGNLIPYCGPFIAYVSTILVCLMTGDYKKLLVSLVALLIVQVIDANIIQPKLLSNSIDIHPLIVIISLIFGSAVGGLMGMFLAVPVGALVKLRFVRFIETRLEKKVSRELDQ